MASTKQKSFTILLVEDDAGDVDLFLRTVEPELPRHEDDEITLVINATAEGAIERLQKDAVDLIIADVRLPGISGIELLRRVQDLNRRIPVIMLSRVDATETVIDAMRHGAFDYVVKPYDAMDLAARIHRAMRMSEILLQATPDEPVAPRIPFKNLVGVSAPIPTSPMSALTAAPPTPHPAAGPAPSTSSAASQQQQQPPSSPSPPVDHQCT